jgi:hypothetical protein
MNTKETEMESTIVILTDGDLIMNSWEREVSFLYDGTEYAGCLHWNYHDGYKFYCSDQDMELPDELDLWELGELLE